MGSQTRDYLIAAQHETLTHDLDGNLATDSLWSYTYDAENRLVRMTSLLPSGQGFTRAGRSRLKPAQGKRGWKLTDGRPPSQARRWRGCRPSTPPPVF
jgi:YD repeat-containing protein